MTRRRKKQEYFIGPEMSSGKRNKKSRRQLAKRLSKYTTAAAACGAVVGGLPEKSEAEIISFTGPVTSGAFSFDLTAGTASSGDFAFSFFGGYSLATGGYASSFLNFYPGSGAFSYAAAAGFSSSFFNFLTSGDTVGPSLNFVSYINHNAPPSSNFFVGLRLLGDSPSPLFGWAELSLDFGASQATLHAWAYEDSGVSINAGATESATEPAAPAVPEPSSAAMMALSTMLLAGGLTSLRTLRRRRRAEQKGAGNDQNKA